VFTAGDIAKALTAFEVMNPELVICHLDPDASFTIVLTINRGRGWVPAEENVTPQDDIDTIAIDSIYTPIKNVKYTVDEEQGSLRFTLPNNLTREERHDADIVLNTMLAGLMDFYGEYSDYINLEVI